jgi:hypothetical protein
MRVAGGSAGPSILAVLLLAGCPRAQIVAIPTACTFDGGPEPLNPNHQLSYQVAAGARNPANDCQGCVPQTNPSDWTVLDPGTPCGDDGGMFCDPAQRCTASCFIRGVLFNPGADPKDGCQLCIPNLSATEWTPRLCQPGTDSVCVGGNCEPGCLIDGGFVSPGDSNPGNACLACLPDASTAAWSPRPAGTPCEDASHCLGGYCIPGCFIDGAVYQSGQSDVADVCKACLPDGGSLTDWSVVPDGTPCNDGGVCEGDRCCSPLKSPCGTSADCCNSMLPCIQGACTCAQPGVCGECTGSQDCCWGYCLDLSSGCGKTCVTNAIGQPCAADKECASGSCSDAGACLCLPSGMRLPLPEECSECCGGWCMPDGFTCGCNDAGAGTVCLFDTECCNGRCIDGGCN